MSDLFKAQYNPDVLSCIANLSNDEVFTPPEVANQMLDLLPKEIWSDPNVTFLDPACKSGVFLRECAKRLIEGQLPGYQLRVDEINEKKAEGEELDEADESYLLQLEAVLENIFKRQLYGMAITELTSLLSRRSVYCSKFPNSDWSVVKFDNPEGNIDYKRMEHDWYGGRCSICGATKKQYDRGESREIYAYEFIHLDNPEEVFCMKFDVVVGNPPYQLNFGIEGGNSANAKSIYNLFISQAIKLNPRYLCMITPSRWMTKTAQGIPEAWVNEMLLSNKFRIMHDYEDASACFPGVEIKGGVSYFLWERDYHGSCEYHFHPAGNREEIIRNDYLDSKNAGIVVRDPQAYSILAKIEAVEGAYYNDDDRNFSGLVSAKHFFDNSELLTSNWTGYKDERSDEYHIKYYLNIKRERTFRWISDRQLPKNAATKDLCKVFIPAAGGSGHDDLVLGKPFYGEPGSVCSQTFLVIGYDPKKHNFTESQCQNILTYIKSRLLRYLVSIKKKTQNGPRGVYQFVPVQNFDVNWTDQKLYDKYGLNEEEIRFIESTIRPLDATEVSNA